MKTLIALFMMLAGFACAGPIDEAYAERIAEAIWHAEGGPKAKVSHGVLSVRTRSPEHAREVCLRTIRRSWDRYYRAGCSGDFIEHLGSTYCPIKGDKTGLNRHWTKNVRFFLSRPRKRDFSVL